MRKTVSLSRHQYTHTRPHNTNPRWTTLIANCCSIRLQNSITDIQVFKSPVRTIVDAYQPPRSLGLSSQANHLCVIRSRTSFSSRAFCHAVLTIWNCLPAELTNNLSSIASLKRCLKTINRSITNTYGPPRLRFIISMTDLWCVTTCELLKSINLSVEGALVRHQ